MGQIVDLTVTLDETLLAIGQRAYPNAPRPFVREELLTHAQAGWQASRISLLVHTGTHIDAPAHLLPDGQTIDQLDLARVVGDAVVLDLQHLPFRHPIVAGDLEAAWRRAEEAGARPRRGDIVLLCSGHHRRTWGTWDYWDFSPFLTAEGASWLVAQGAPSVGYDFFPDPPDLLFKGAPAHRTLLSNGVVGIEYLVGLEEIVNRRVFLVATPLKISGCDGGPARVFAIVG